MPRQRRRSRAWTQIPAFHKTRAGRHRGRAGRGFSWGECQGGEPERMNGARLNLENSLTSLTPSVSGKFHPRACGRALADVGDPARPSGSPNSTDSRDMESSTRVPGELMCRAAQHESRRCALGARSMAVTAPCGESAPSRPETSRPELVALDDEAADSALVDRAPRSDVPTQQASHDSQRE